MLLLYSLLGLAVGSFLNVLMDRLPAGQSVVWPPSHCPSCKTGLAAIQMVPVLSYLALKGRCSYCSSPIPQRVLVVEIATAALFGFLWLWLGQGPKVYLASLYFSVLLVITVIDLEYRLILNKIMYPAIVVAPVVALAYGHDALDILLGGLLGFLFLFLPYLLSGGKLGAGDVKLGAFIGILSGYPNVMVAMFIASVIGGIAAAFLLVTGIKRRGDPVPFAPFLVFGAATGFLWGEQLLDWYLGFI